MNIKASGRSALIIAAGFWVCFSGPSQAAEEAEGGAMVAKTETAAGAPVALNKFTRKSRHWRHASSHRKPAKVTSSEAAKSSTKNKADAAMSDGEAKPALPPSVANANAQLASADMDANGAAALSVQAGNRLQILAANQSDPQPVPNTDLVAADQLNDVDRALSDSKSDDKAPATTLAVAVAQTPSPTQTAQAASVSTDDSAWSQTSLIGKIFIAFGGLLTLASAARMFMA